MNALVLNLPLGFSALASLIFFIFPTTRNGIGYGDASKKKTGKLTADDKKEDFAMDAASDEKKKKSSGPSSSGGQNPNAQE
ncbi:hypothetical protein MRB53_032396 [Persea americana]|uniref:Uncharacterized protein n=1 Tax=Persea americana TaxID=3435 RepID=A0ACC2KRT0_PERAE|nr:hypothetical protein MRB53_032396 [Persea americana]